MKPLRATSGLADWQALLADPGRQWRAGYSAMATARRWEAGFPPEVAQILGAQTELQLCIAEHKVPLPGGGFPSQCDVFALVHADGRDMAVAIEAKVDEPFGPTLTEWMTTPSPAKQARLGAIRDWLGVSANAELGALRYQLFHRSAAAITEARRFRRPVAAMVVQSFSPRTAWFDDFAAFCTLFGHSARPDTGMDVTLPDGLILRLGWARGDTRYLEAA